jgi:alkylhydroperoxidase family enzyme
MTSALRRLKYEELDASVREALEPKVRRLGYLGEFFAVAGHQPAPLLAFNEFTEALKRALPPELTEVVALTAATGLGNDYERCQHERLSLKLGFDLVWIAAAEGRAGSDPASLSDQARCAKDLVLAVLADRGHGAGGAVETAVERLGEEQSVAVLLLIGRYVAHGFVSNSTGLTAPVSSVFDDLGQGESGLDEPGQEAPKVGAARKES